MAIFLHQQPVSFTGTGVVVKGKGILTAAHVVTNKSFFGFYRKPVLCSHIEVFRGVTNTAVGGYAAEELWRGDALIGYQKDFLEKSEPESLVFDIAMIGGTEMETKGGREVFDGIEEMKLCVEKDLSSFISAMCYHYPKGELPQKHSVGYVGLKHNPCFVPLPDSCVHHDLVSTNGSSGAGILTTNGKVCAVLRGHHPTQFNGVINVDQNVIDGLCNNLDRQNKMKKSFLWSLFALASLHSEVFSQENPNPELGSKAPNHRLTSYPNKYGYSTLETPDGKHVITGPGHGWTMQGYFVPNQKLPKWRLAENILMGTPWDCSLEGKKQLFPRRFSGWFPRRAIPLAGVTVSYFLFSKFWAEGMQYKSSLVAPNE